MKRLPKLEQISKMEAESIKIGMSSDQFLETLSEQAILHKDSSFIAVKCSDGGAVGLRLFTIQSGSRSKTVVNDIYWYPQYPNLSIEHHIGNKGGP